MSPQGKDNQPQVGPLARAIANELQQPDAETFLSALRSRRVNEKDLFARIVLWQLEDPIYGLKRIASVRLDRNISRLCEDVARVYQTTVTKGHIPNEERKALHARIEKEWASSGERRKWLAAFISQKLAFVGGGRIADFLTHGWCETWIWIHAATHSPGQGQASVLVWTFARAGSGERDSTDYHIRLRALRDHFLETISV